MNNYKLKGNKILNADIVSPEVVYAEFSAALTITTKKQVFNDLKYGSKLLEIYRKGRDNMHIVDVLKMLEQMEDTYLESVKEKYFER